LNATLFRWLLWGEWRAHPFRIALSVVAIATGVALGFSVDLVNGSAMSAFGAAVSAISGNADFEIVSRSNAGFEENLYPQIAMLKDVAVASPMVEVKVAVADSNVRLDVLGVDAFSARRINPLIAEASGSASNTLRLLDTSAISVSEDVLHRLGKKPGDTITVIVDGTPVQLLISAALASPNPDLALMDISAAQWRLHRLGRLSRISLRKRDGITDDSFRSAVLPLLPPDTTLVAPADRDHRTSQLSRAYRFNLDMLALMALFTGGFLVYSTQSLSVMRRRPETALLRIIGASRGQMIAQILVEGGVLGVAGSALGLVAGALIADAVLRIFGPDLGGGYFAKGPAALVVSPLSAAIFFALGLVAAFAGSWFPARQVERITPAESVKARDDIVDPRERPRVRTSLVMLCIAAAALMLPAIDGLPIAGSFAIGVLLIAGIAAMPFVVRLVVGSIIRLCDNAWLPFAMALKRLWGAPTQSTVALCGIVASVSLMVSMAVMVASFRDSVDTWVMQILPADLYLHLDGPAESIGMDRSDQARLRRLPGIASIDFLKVVPLTLSAGQPPVSLLARDYAGDRPTGLPVISAAKKSIEGTYPVWISEAMSDLYGWHVGDLRHLPLADQKGHTRDVEVGVTGIWRDYARQTGAIVMRARDYATETGDVSRTDAALTLSPGADAKSVKAEVVAALPATTVEHATITSPVEIRRASLAIFDRSFSITYLLEGVAICIGLFGVAATFSAQTIGRAHEFGMLRHLGVRRREVLAMLASEGLMLGIIGAVAGFLLGLVQGLILIKVVNPQSFHWTMQTHIPLGLISAILVAMLAASAGTAVLAGRAALSVSALRAVREDW
jgi:putative ABC transport system permease protein